MILISGKSDCLEDALVRKFRDMRENNVVRLESGTGLMDYLTAYHRDINALYYFEQCRKTSESSFRMDFFQLLWSFATKQNIPLNLIFHKYKSDFSIDDQLARFADWVGKQYRNPPFHYIFEMGEVYGGDFRNPVFEEYYRQISTTGVAVVAQATDEHGGQLERQMDYVSLPDVMRVLYWFQIHRPESGIYELGSGFPRTDTAVVNAIFRTLKRPPHIQYLPNGAVWDEIGVPACPTDLSHLRRVGYKKTFCPIEKGMKMWVRRHFLQ